MSYRFTGPRARELREETFHDARGRELCSWCCETVEGFCHASGCNAHRECSWPGCRSKLWEDANLQSGACDDHMCAFCGERPAEDTTCATDDPLCGACWKRLQCTECGDVPGHLGDDEQGYRCGDCDERTMPVPRSLIPWGAPGWEHDTP